MTEPMTLEELAELREMKAAEDGLEGFYLTERRLLATIATLTAERAQYKEANQTMHDAFMEVRAKLNAWDTPHAPSTEAIVACVSRHLHELVAERDQLIEELAGCHCGRSMVHKSCVAARDKLAAEVARLRPALEETAARLEAHQHIMCSECEGIRLFVASALDAEAWE